MESYMSLVESVNVGQENGWRKVKDLGSGTFGDVSLWKSFSPNDKPIALKIFRIPADIARNSEKKEKLENRYKDEVDRMYNIDFEYIVGTINISRELEEEIRNEITASTTSTRNGHLLLSPLLGMEYCCGGDLERLLSQPEHLSGLPEEEVLAVLGNISKAIQHLHSVPIGENRYIIHRDIKPANIVIQLRGWKRVYKLSDLGLAKDINDVSECSSLVGTKLYMAPEILRGSKYDKTVDYYSFGLIAYEISCGTLPPKKDNVYFIEIPSRTRLSDFFQVCLNNWIPTMVENEPKNRGKYKIVTKEGEAITPSLAWLQNLLEAYFLQIYTCMKGRLVFRVKSDTKIKKVQDWIAGNTGLSMEDQLLLTAEGVNVSPAEMALTKATVNCKLYLVAKFGQQICSKIKIKDEILSRFVMEDLTSFNPASIITQMEKLWPVAIFYIETQLERTQNLLMIEKALKNRENITGSKTASVMQNEIRRMKEMYMQFRDHRASFVALVNMQEKLDQIDEKFVSELGSYLPLKDIKTSADDLHRRIETYFEKYFNYCNGNGLQNLQATSDFDLIRLHKKFFDEFKLWNAIPRPSDGHSYTSKNVADVRETILSFLSKQQSILTNLDNNIQVLLLRGVDSYRRVEHWLEESKGFQNQVIERGLKKQKMIWNFANIPPLSPDPVVNAERGNTASGFSAESISSIPLLTLENCIDNLLD